MEREERPWGDFITLFEEKGFKVKVITVKPGKRLSLQRHKKRSERWVVAKGTAIVTKGSEVIMLGEADTVFIEVGEEHRLENPGNEPLKIVEVQLGEELLEEDIERLEDDWGRK